MTANLLWFHAFSRTSVQDLIRVLTHGVEPPEWTTSTKENESILGLPQRVYAYLGRTLEAFGNSVIVLRIPAPEGSVSPFDTGGMVKKIQPVCSWTAEEKSDYIERATWPVPKSTMVLRTVYPGSDVEGYLSGKQPIMSGPYQICPRIPAADIWAVNTDWRAWTWELRAPKLDPSQKNLAHWATTTVNRKLFGDQVDNATTDEEKEVLLYLDETLFRHGGVSELLEHLREVQANG